ncbi:MAG TPA: class I SAM-dependent methyltransferase [Gemmataceae bacterium]|nr:class I SAM-dependent methyltransferase [Gemmataceae bacterium]
MIRVKRLLSEVFHPATAERPPERQPKPEEEILYLDFPACIAADFPDEFPAALQATQEVQAAIRNADLSPLARHSPGLKDFCWDSYLNCSLVRIVQAAAALRERSVIGGRILDYGSYFGNFSLAFARLGYQVDAVDSYQTYGEAFAGVLPLLRKAGVRPLDFAEVRYDLMGLDSESYDVVLCMGVIEHIPHTPRPLLEALNRALKTGGRLLLDTPNLAYIYNRQRLARGESIFCPIALQYDTAIPFEGHHREYTAAEVEWMLRRLGHENITLRTFNYSFYGCPSLRGLDLENYRTALADPSCREIILAVSEKPLRGAK